ncbi:hypothetical protein PORY_000609 [Pneumocystis oryctolagi]|uniref:Uncharacterized protein n=1 Tax=Pneumocystis oryctolagi TaxID=42067 RepID=A0ACB7CFN0_9ASCO|nr:hypothetical protein PORY_000609 [Pneumocystis oryctolagi]
MKVAALISGGKDSCFNMMYCMANGHEIIALANLQPLEQHEIDSYMYQTVGQEVVKLYGEAMNIPLYCEFITGTSIDQSLTYQKTFGDETEDLYRLIKRIQGLHPNLEAISVGAILSSYQKTRVESVCKRLGLVCLAYLWKRDQKELLEEMISRNLHAIIIKVSSLGLNKSHLGKSLIEIKDHLLEMNKRYDLNLCGEGGEYESLVLDCPIFQKRIKIIKSEIIDHSSGDVAYLKLIAKLEEKSFINVKWKEEFILPNILDEKYKLFKECIDENYDDKDYSEIYRTPRISIKEYDNDRIFISSSKLNDLVAIGNVSACLDPRISMTHTLDEEFHCCMNRLKGNNLMNYGLEFHDIIFVELLFKKESYLSLIDPLYNQYFDFLKPPPRICINCHSLKLNRLQISVLANSSHKKRSVIYSYSQNCWIPANIGSYSHALVFENIIFTSSQIGIIPSTMRLPYPKSFSSEIVISLQNLERIIENARIFDISCVAFISDKFHVLPTNSAWKRSFLYDSDCLIILVNSLSYGALIEWNITGKRKYESSYDEIIENNFWSILYLNFKNFQNSELSLEEILNTLLDSFKKSMMNGKILSSTIYYNRKSFKKIESPEIISAVISDTIQSILGYEIESHCISTNGLWISGETVTPVAIAMKVICFSSYV